MFMKVGVILLIFRVCTGQEKNHDWDLAVTVFDQVQLLSSNGSLIGTKESFSNLKALTFDNIRHNFVLSDMYQENDTIFSVPLQKENTFPIVEDLPDDVQGLAIDPLSDVLYWTDPKNKTINYVHLEGPLDQPHVFMAFNDEEPQDLAIDSCRRYIYWTNSNMDNPTIDRASLDGTNHEILISTDLFIPAGIAIDYISRKIYWANIGQGIYYKIESSNLDGQNRQIVFQGTHQKPFGVAVDEESVYWTDMINNALWRIQKAYEEPPSQISVFKEKPMGLIAKHLGFAGTPDCKNIIEAISNYNESTTEYYEIAADNIDVISQCLNNGKESEHGCVCHSGFTGVRCEISLCYNYCVRGNCYHTQFGYPRCHCPVGLIGNRCEKDACDKFCLNGGVCQHNRSSIWGASCSCPRGYGGERCEINRNVTELCNWFCQSEHNDEVLAQKASLVCRCHGKEAYSYNIINDTKVEAVKTEKEHISLVKHLEDPDFLILSACMLLSLCIIVVLTALLCKSKKRRPRINKRIIVNKNVTPLTYRPQSNSPECQITIENCCNMNECETPCFEPPQLTKALKNAKDEKKTLLTNMENGDDLY